MSGPCDDERDVATEKTHQEPALHASFASHRGSTQSDLFGSQGDVRNSVSRRPDVVAEIAGTQANTDTCQWTGRARLRVFGVLDQADFLKLHRGLRMTCERPSHGGRRGENRKSCYNIAFHRYLPYDSARVEEIQTAYSTARGRSIGNSHGLFHRPREEY